MHQLPAFRGQNGSDSGSHLTLETNSGLNLILSVAFWENSKVFLFVCLPEEAILQASWDDSSHRAMTTGKQTNNLLGRLGGWERDGMPKIKSACLI